jgi:hypothetical protein
MDRPFIKGASINSARLQGFRRSDLAMSVLQYGTAIIAIVAVTLLGLIR